MLGHRSDLQERAIRTEDKARRAALEEQAETLEKYAVILNVVYIQLKPERWSPATMGGLLELAAKHNITFPEWMKPT